MNIFVFSSKPSNGLKAGEEESFVIQFDGSREQAENWVASQKSKFTRDYICTQLPIKRDKPVLLCHHIMPVDLEPKIAASDFGSLDGAGDLDDEDDLL